MPQSYSEGQRLLGSDGQTYIVHNGTPVLESTVPRTFGTPDPTQPLKVPEAQAKIDNTQTDTATARAKLPYVAPLAAADVRKSTAEAQRITQDTSRGPTVDEARTKAINAYFAALELGKQIQSMRQRFSEGPGATKGVFGLEDYLPLTSNQRFDAAANAARGNVGNAFGFTGSQLNTPSEVSMNIGPYLPQSSDRDQVAIDKMNQLQDLRDRALHQAIAQLGGIPDANGKVTPVAPGQERQAVASVSLDPSAPSGPSGPMGSTPMPGGTSGGNTMSLSPGGFTTKLVDPPATARASFSLLMRGKPTDDQMRQWGAKFGYDVTPYIEARQKNPNVTPTLGKTIQRIPLSGLAAGINKVASNPVGAGVIGAADAVTGGFLDNLTGNPEQTRAVMDLSRAQNPNSTLAGNIAGGALAAYGGEAALGAGATRLGLTGAARFAPLAGDALYGAVNGAGTADNGNRLEGAAFGAALSATGGAAGRGAARAIGGTARGVQDASVRYLANRGIPLTVGQTLGQGGLFGRAVKGVEDRLSGIPIVGDAVNARRNEGLASFNQAAFNDALAPIGGNTGGAIGADGVALANDAVNAGYGRALNGVSVAPDPQFATDLAAAVSAGRNIPRTGQEFGHVFDNSVAPVINAPAGPMGGRQIQDILQTVRSTNFGNDAMGNAANDALGNVGNTLSGLVERQAPGVMGDLQAANSAYRHTGIVRDAVNAARNGTGGEIGTFTPSQLTNASAANARRFGGTQGTTAQPFYNLTEAAQTVLPSKVADSGTAGRLALLSLPAALGGAGGGAGYATGDTAQGSKAGLGLGALLALGGTRAGQRILTRTLLDRPDFAVRIGDRIIRRQGLFGAPMAAASQQLLQQ